MALLEEWILRERVSPSLAPRLIEVVSAIVPAEHEPSVRAERGGERFVVLAHVAEDEIVELARALDEPLGFFDEWDWEADLDALDGGDHELWIELENKEPETVVGSERGVLSVYSKDGTNHAGWPAAFVLAARIAQALGAIEAEAWSEGN